MAHELTVTNGKVEMGFLAGTNRWHGLGNELTEGATIEQWIETAGMAWKVQRSKVRYAVDRSAQTFEWPDQHVLFRSDTKAPLAIVSDGFKIVQPRECLEFFRDLCETNGFALRTAGTLFGGKRFWALADIGAESFVLDPKDRVKGRLLLVTACDGSMKTTAKFVSECVVCNNTLTIARGESGKEIAVSHRSVFNPTDTKMQLGLADGQFGKFIADVRRLAERKFSAADTDDFTVMLLANSKPLDGLEEEAVRATRNYKSIMELFEGKGIAADMRGRQGTAWGWVNSISEYVDHHAAARSNDNRFNSSQFGAGEKMKNDALAIALAA